MYLKEESALIFKPVINSNIKIEYEDTIPAYERLYGKYSQLQEKLKE